MGLHELCKEGMKKESAHQGENKTSLAKVLMELEIIHTRT